MRLTIHHHSQMKNWVCSLFIPHKQYSKVFYFKELGLLTLTKFWLHLRVNYSTFSFKKVKLINFTNIYFSIFHLYLLHIIKFPFNILTFYFQTIHFLLPFSKSCFNLVLVLSLHFSFHYSLNKVPSFSGFLICITMKLRNLAFWCKWLSLV